MTSEYLDADGVIGLLPGQTRNSLYAQRYRNVPPGSLGVRVGKRILWRRADIEDWFANRQTGRSQAGAQS